MAILSMQKIGICATKKNRKAILEFLQEIGAVEVDVSDIESEEYERMDTSNERIRFQNIADDFDHVIELLKTYDEERKKSLLNLEKRQITMQEEQEIVADRVKYYNTVNKIIALEKSIAESRATIARKNNKIASLKPWQSLGIPLNSEKTKKTRIFIGSFPVSLSEEQILTIACKDMDDNPPVIVEILSSDNQVTNVCVVATNNIADKVEENMRSGGYSKLPFLSHRIPINAIEKRQNDIVEEEKKIQEAEDDIKNYVNLIDNLCIASDYYRTRAEKYRILGTIPQSKNVFFIEGWIEKDKSERVAKLLEEKFGAFVELQDVDDSVDQPVVLKNNAFSEAAEGVLESYGLPKHGRVDPTFVMSLFYVFFFGMMLSDAAYGILMSIITAVVLKKYPRMESGLKKMLKLFFWCGLSTAFWGFMFGGFFGDAIDVIAHTFCGVPETTQVLKPLWFAPLDNPMRLLIWCMLFGLIHLFAGLGMKGYEYLKDHDVVGFVSDVIAWYMFIGGLVLMLIPSSIFASVSQMQIVFPDWLNMGAKILTIAGMAIIILMSGRANKNWGIRIALGAYDIYGVTGWLSDVLSYSRLLALGLATGVIASVINSMAIMQGKTVIGVIVFILVFIVGHTLNIAINLLGAYVHTNRLQYVEFFGKFYDAGGEPFRPFKTNNKYIEIKED